MFTTCLHTVVTVFMLGFFSTIMNKVIKVGLVNCVNFLGFIWDESIISDFTILCVAVHVNSLFFGSFSPTTMLFSRRGCLVDQLYKKKFVVKERLKTTCVEH